MKQKKASNVLRNMVYAAMCLTLCIVLPFLTGQIPEVGNMLCPMHIPVLLAGFLCGPGWALAVGLLAPGLRFLLFSMPPIFPIGLAMSFELATYGLVSGCLYRLLPKKTSNIYLSLIGDMLVGREVWGLAYVVIAGLSEVTFSWAMFLSGAFTTAIPGIIVHIVVIPVLVVALQRARIIERN